MEKKKDLICIGCPLGCNLEVKFENDLVSEITGYSCKRGLDYANNECTDPKRILTTTIKVEQGRMPIVSVKTNTDIPKISVTPCIKELKNIKVKAPIHIGDVIVYNILGTGSNIVATMEVLAI